MPFFFTASGSDEDHSEVLGQQDYLRLAVKSEKSPLKVVQKWSEVNDDFAIVNKFLKPLSGEIKLSIPFVNVPLGPKFSIKYDLTYAQLHETGNLELGLLDDFIMVDSSRSVFADDLAYVLHSGGSQVPLTRVSGNEFKVKDVDVTLNFDSVAQKWTLDTAKERHVYGKIDGNGAILAEDSGKLPSAWFIAEKHDKVLGQSVNFRYRALASTSDILLEKICTKDGEISIDFTYESDDQRLLGVKISTDIYQQVS